MISSSLRLNIACFYFHTEIRPFKELLQVYRVENKTEHRNARRRLWPVTSVRIWYCGPAHLSSQASTPPSFTPAVLGHCDCRSDFHVPVLKEKAIMGALSRGNNNKKSFKTRSRKREGVTALQKAGDGWGELPWRKWLNVFRKSRMLFHEKLSFFLDFASDPMNLFIHWKCSQLNQQSSLKEKNVGKVNVFHRP